MSKGWIGVDLDGCLATYDKWVSIEHIGEPVWPMVRRVKEWLLAGQEVRIFTARVYCAVAKDWDERLTKQDLLKYLTDFDHNFDYKRVIEAQIARMVIQEWCQKVFGQVLQVTCQKDPGMIELWDDRCVQVEANTGQLSIEAALNLRNNGTGNKS